MRSVAGCVKKKRRVAGAIIVLLGFGLPFAGTVNAQSNELNHTLNDKWIFWIGGFFPSSNTVVQIDSGIGNPGDKFSLEEFLGIGDNKGVAWGGFRWRISRRNQLEFELSTLSNDGFNSFRVTDLDIGEFTIDAAASIATDFRLSLARITYGFSVVRKEKHDLALKAGVHLMQTSLEFEAEGIIRQSDPPNTNVCGPNPNDMCKKTVSTDEFTFPLPHFGLSYDYAISPKWELRTQLLGFVIEINDIKGTLAEIDLDLRFQPWTHFGFGAGYRFFAVRVEDKGNSFFDGEFEYNYDGPVLYVLGTF